MEKSESKGNMSYYLSIALPLLIITSVIAILMAAVNAITWERIERNENEAMYSSIEEIFPSYEDIKKLDGEVSSPVNAIYEISEGGQITGWCVHSSPKGFGGTVELMTGISSDGKIIGVRVVSNSETPGVGSRATESVYLDAYAGLSGSLTLGNGVDAISGATITSKGILAGVNASLTAVSGLLSQTEVSK